MSVTKWRNSQQWIWDERKYASNGTKYFFIGNSLVDPIIEDDVDVTKDGSQTPTVTMKEKTQSVIGVGQDDELFNWNEWIR